jgi:hypothetical protein
MNQVTNRFANQPNKWIWMLCFQTTFYISTMLCSLISNHINQRQPGIDEEINYPIAVYNSSQPTPINLDSSGLRRSSRTEVLNRRGLVYSDTTLMDHDERPTSPKTAHLRSASQQSFSSARVPFSNICPFGGLSCWV